MNGLSLERTDQTGIWKLICAGRRTWHADPVQEEGLLRGTLPYLAPADWFVDPSGAVYFCPDSTNRMTLKEAAESGVRTPETGRALFQKIPEAVSAVRDHLFPVIPELLIPELLYFSSEDTSGEKSPQLVSLPFPEADPGKVDPVAGTALVDWFSSIFNWPDAMRRACLEEWKEGRHASPAEAKTETKMKSKITAIEQEAEQEKIQQTTQEEKREAFSPASDAMDSRPRQPNPLKHGISHRIRGSLRGIYARFFGDDFSVREEETTEDLDLSSGTLRIAQLSEGLPGTPEEEYGRHAYILTDHFLIGRDIRKADLLIDSPSASRLHAQITRNGGNFFIEDLGSKNGTTVEGVKIKRHTSQLLPEMCRLSFADSVFYFRSD